MTEVASQTTSMPDDGAMTIQHQPKILRNRRGRIYAALMLEKVELRGGNLEILGWCVGDAEITLQCEHQGVNFAVEQLSRPDVKQTLQLDGPGEQFGFHLRAAVLNDNICLGWAAREGRKVHTFEFLLEVDVLSSEVQLKVVGGPDDEQTMAPLEAQAPVAQIRFDQFVGALGTGWSANEALEGAVVNVSFGGQFLGQARPAIKRTDVQSFLGAPGAKLGYQVMLGGPLQFSVLSDCKMVTLSQPGRPGSPCQLVLADHLSEALTFSPLRSFNRHDDVAKMGSPRAIKYLSDKQVSILFESGMAKEGDEDTTMFIDFYQEHAPGQLSRLSRLAIERTGQVINLEFRVLSATAPILFVATDAERNIILSDCFPLPSLFMASNIPLLDYHSMLGGGKLYYDEAAKLSRNYLDVAIKRASGELGELPDQPGRQNTLLVLFARDEFDPLAGIDAPAFANIGDQLAFLERDGTIRMGDQPAESLAQFLHRRPSQFVLFCEINCALRPDFWAIVEQNRSRLALRPALVHWDYILTDGLQRPYLMKLPLLLDETFRSHDLVYTNGLIARSDVVLAAIEQHGADFRSGRLKLEHAFSFVAKEQVLRLPFVMDIARRKIPPQKQLDAWTRQRPVRHTPVPRAASQLSQGISIIINYRNSEKDTVGCLDAIKSQDFPDAIEIILVNNGSLPDISQRICEHAKRLFGEAAVKAIDYEQTFNHSTQCNIAARAASHEFLLMLSNDSFLLTSDALQRAREVAAIPWVGTCGFRVIGTKNQKMSLQSFGLAVGRGSDVFFGGPFLTTNIAPDFILDQTMEVIGNTFGVVLLRREVYWQLNGLDELAFPTNYNDVDFCLRASAAGYRHVVVGAAVVEHVGRGSREFDLDLPIEQGIFDRAPPLKVLTAIGTIKL